MEIVKNILRPALDFVLPERCPSCGVITPAGGDFCSDCWSRLYFPTGPCCSSCDVPLPFLESEGQQCLACLAKTPIHNGIKAAVAYGDVSRQVALKLKYGGKIGLAKVIANHLARHLPEQRDGLLVTPVPLHWTRLWSRSFNQSALIAKSLAQHNGLTYAPDMLIRQKRTPLLRGMTAKERRNTVGKAFALNTRWLDSAKGARILLIDDVYTSGATSEACIKALKKAGAGWVQLFCWARVLADHHEIVSEQDKVKA